jgi:hypothetical protein
LCNTKVTYQAYGYASTGGTQGAKIILNGGNNGGGSISFMNDATTTCLMTVSYLGIKTTDPKCHLQVNGIGNINNGSPIMTPIAVPNGYMQSGSLTIGGTHANCGGGNLWNANTAGLLM